MWAPPSTGSWGGVWGQFPDTDTRARWTTTTAHGHANCSPLSLLIRIETSMGQKCLSHRYLTWKYPMSSVFSALRDRVHRKRPNAETPTATTRERPKEPQDMCPVQEPHIVVGEDGRCGSRRVPEIVSIGEVPALSRIRPLVLASGVRRALTDCAARKPSG